MTEEKKSSVDICKKRLEDISIVEIYFGSPFLKKYKRDVQTTLMGKISNIGEYNYFNSAFECMFLI